MEAFNFDDDEIINLYDYWGEEAEDILEREDMNDEIPYEELPENIDELNFGPRDEYPNFNDDAKLLTIQDVERFLRVRGNNLRNLYLSKFYIRNPKTWRKILYILNTSNRSIYRLLEMCISPIVYIPLLKNRFMIGYLTEEEVQGVLDVLRDLFILFRNNPHVDTLYRFLKYVEELYQDDEFRYVMERRREYINQWNRNRRMQVQEREDILREPLDLNMNLDYEIPEYEEEYYYTDED